MATIPELRDELTAMSERLLEIVEELKRRPPAKPRAAPTSTPMNPVLRKRIRSYHKAHPTRAFHEIALVFKVNPARVSEAISGKRT